MKEVDKGNEVSRKDFKERNDEKRFNLLRHITRRSMKFQSELARKLIKDWTASNKKSIAERDMPR